MYSLSKCHDPTTLSEKVCGGISFVEYNVLHKCKKREFGFPPVGCTPFLNPMDCGSILIIAECLNYFE